MLRLLAGERPSGHFLTVPPTMDPAAPGEKGVFLVACNIRMATEVPDVAGVSVAWPRAHRWLAPAPPPLRCIGFRWRLGRRDCRRAYGQRH